MLSANFWRLAHALGTVKAQLFCCTEDMIASLVRGDAFIAYDVLGSYAFSTLACNPTSRLFCGRLRGGGGTDHRNPRRAAHPMLATNFVNYVFRVRPGRRGEAFGLSVTGLGTIVNR